MSRHGWRAIGVYFGAYLTLLLIFDVDTPRAIVAALLAQAIYYWWVPEPQHEVDTRKVHKHLTERFREERSRERWER